MPTALLLADGRRVDPARLPEGCQAKYGRIYGPGVTAQRIELEAFSLDLKPPFGLGRFEHYKRFHAVTWPEREWNCWTELKIRAACEHNILAVIGCTSCAKSDDFAHLGWTWYQAAPQDTVVVIVSTTLDAARGRIWAHLRTAHARARWYADDTFMALAPTPGVITEHPSPMLRLTKERGGVDAAQNQAIVVMPAGADTDRSVAINKLQGTHNKRVIVLYDELQSLGTGVVTEALPNLFSNAEVFVYGFGNFTHPGDALGLFAKPTMPGGYNAIGEATKEWPTEVMGKPGHCVRIDGEDTPNKESYLRDGTERFPYLLKYSEVLERKAALARDPSNPLLISAWHRQVKALPRPEGTEDTPYSYQAIETFGACKPPQWVNEGAFQRVCGVDPSRTAGGDEFSVCFAGYGRALVPKVPGGLETVEKWVIAFLEWVSLETDETPRAPAMARKLRAACAERGVSAAHVAIDCTGADTFGDVVAAEWSNDFLRSTWGGTPSDLPVSVHDPRRCKDIYDRRSSELWCVGADFMRHHQLCGMSAEVAEQFSKRRVSVGKGGKISVEDKGTFKASFGRSPDKPDAACLAIEVCRARLGAMAGEEGAEARAQVWQAAAKKAALPVPRLRSHRGIRAFGR